MHYKDGTPAHVGDVVKGTCYNTKGTIVGILSEITSTSSDTCNCKVAIRMVLTEYGSTRVLLESSATDYSECKALEKVC